MRLPFATDSFDAVGALQVIEHVLPTDVFVSEIARVLKPGGLAYITTPNIDRLPATASKDFNPHHVRDFNPADVRASLDVSFAEVEMLGQVLDESLPKVQRLLEGAEQEWKLVGSVERVERIVRKLPGPLRVRLRRMLLRSAGIPAWPLPEVEAVRDEIRAEDFRAEAPAENSGCIVAIARGPR